MTPAPPSPLAEELAAALAWWRTAGVDRTYRDEAAGWLGSADEQPQPEPEQRDRPAEPIAPAHVARLGGNRSTWPATLDAFADWWMTEPSLDQGGVTPRVPPRGAASAKLMLVVAMPEENDDVRLLSGAQGAFLEAILSAFGIAQSEVYLAAALPRHTALPDVEELRLAGLGDVLAHHIALVAPERLLTFGRLVPPLLGHDTAQRPAATPIFNHEGVRVPTLAAGGLDRLLRSAAAREAFWRRWLDWTDGER
jgi:DNA polymerase